LSELAERLAPIRSRLGRVRTAIRGLYLLDGLSRLALAAGAFVLATFLIDWSLILPRGLRLFFLAGGLAGFAALAWKRIVYPGRVAISDDDLAIFVERHYPDLNDLLISALQLSRGQGATGSPELVAAVVAQADEAAAQVDFARIVNRRHVGRLAGGAAATLLALGLSALALPEHASIYANRVFGGVRKWPQRTHLTVLDFPDGRRVVARGEDLTLAVEVKGREPSKILLSYAFASGEKGVERMSPHAGGRFAFTFTRVAGPFRFRVEGGDDVTAEHEVAVVTPPSLDQVRLFYEYPAYLRLENTPPERPETGGSVTAPIGTRVSFHAVANEDLESATLVVGLKGREEVRALALAPVSDGAPRGLSGGFEVIEAVSEYAITLKARNGLANRDPIRFAIKGVEDRPPEIVVRDPLYDEFVTDLCVRPLEAEVRDDYGIARIGLEVRVLAQQPDKTRDWATTPFTREQNSRDYGETQIRCESSLDVSALSLSPGDHVELRFRAEDYREDERKRFRLSKVYKLSVVSVGTLEKELQDAIERVKVLLKAQKQRQDAGVNRTGRLLQTFGRLDQLTPEQQSEVRQGGLEQNDVTSKLDGARRDVAHLMRRGIYNKIFNESAAQKLQGAIEALEAAVGQPGDVARPGLSRIAAAKLDGSARLKAAEERSTALREAQGLQGEVSKSIQKALEFLDKWSSYQEVIRVAREIKEAQDRVNQDIKKSGKGR
jgi:hypothetical protein